MYLSACSGCIVAVRHWGGGKGIEGCWALGHGYPKVSFEVMEVLSDGAIQVHQLQSVNHDDLCFSLDVNQKVFMPVLMTWKGPSLHRGEQ